MFAFLAAALLLQDSAADFYKKVEEKYAAATSLSLTTEMQVLSTKDGVERVMSRHEGKLKAKGEGKINAELSVERDGKPLRIAEYVSDGRALHIRHFGRAAERKEHSLHLGTWARRFCARLGLTSSIGASLGSVTQPDDLKLDRLFLVSDFADDGKEKVGDVQCRIVTYQVTQIEARLRPLKCRAWIDPEKLAVLKHEVADGTTVIREIHSNVTFDADLPDDQFKIP